VKATRLLSTIERIVGYTVRKYGSQSRTPDGNPRRPARRLISVADLQLRCR
jgi:hypothetical protein